MVLNSEMQLMMEQQSHEKLFWFLTFCLHVHSNLKSMYFLVTVFLSMCLLMCHPESFLYGRQDSMDTCHHP